MILNIEAYCDYSDMCRKLRDLPCFIEWDDIEIGKTYHIPPILNYDRRDFVVKHKDENKLSVTMISDSSFKTPYDYTFFKSEVSPKFMSEKLR